MQPPETPPQHTIWRSILRWTPTVILSIAGPGLLIAAITHTNIGNVAWQFFIGLTPILGILLFVAVSAFAVYKRSFSKPILIALGLSVFCWYPLLGQLRLLPLKYPISLESASPSATIRLPSNETLQVVWGGDKARQNYHVMMPDQRWAYDLLVDPFLHGSDSLETYGCYGTPVVAPVAARVAATHDGEPDAIPGATSNNFLKPYGNYVALLLPTDTYLLIAHLKPESVQVEEGDEVKEGDVIGACGNSGNTSEPHIHIHHQRQNPSEVPVGFAQGLPLFFRDLDGPEMPTGGIKKEGDGFVSTGHTVRHLTPADSPTQPGDN